MKPVELAIGVLLVLGGLRAIWVWGRRRFEAADVVDHLLYALYLTGRIGQWFALAGFFLIYAALEERGRAALDELERYRWYLVVPLGLAALQLGAGWLLGNRSSADEG